MADEAQIEAQIIQTEETVDTTDGNVSTKETVRVIEKRRIVVDMNGTSATTKKYGTDSHDNPFTADGELSKKARYILEHSTISRSEIRISDPDLSKSHDRSEIPTEESPLVCQEAAPVQSARLPEEEKLKENGKVEPALTPQSVQVEVGTANASQPQPQQAEQVKLKEPKCKCCVVM